eukprot:TRINITY_DN1574_c0_g1_i3.p1 TRINITY_DN1574_c0_g1~~TRINITY_DN1574_c0_g1_i3.p1  ORF type:complete len:406 (-),score=54.97 TRINITY_DN1574_c0_g1_i3:120-1337(-)
MIYLIDQASNSQRQQFEQDELDILNGNSKILMSLINDILDYCQHKNQSLRLIIETFRLSEMINEIFKTMGILAKLKKLKLKIENYLPDEFEITSDRRRVTQVLMNLISNALKFTRSGWIRVKIYKRSQDRNIIYFEVKDTGSGMSEDVIKKLGGEYSTFGQCTNENKEGIGLGLYISKQIISALGPSKTFTIESQINQGSKFYFPIFENYSEKNEFNIQEIGSSKESNCSSFSEEKIGLDINQQVLLYNNSKFNDSSFKSISSISVQESKLNFVANIMIVDDNPFNLFVLNKQLIKLNESFTIFEAKDGQEAVEIYASQIKQSNIPLILMDCQMPILNGYEATKIIKEKALEYNQFVRVIGYTAYWTDEECRKCKSYGMDDCLQKPTPESVLFKLIEKEFSQLQK